MSFVGSFSEFPAAVLARDQSGVFSGGRRGQHPNVPAGLFHFLQLLHVLHLLDELLVLLLPLRNRPRFLDLLFFSLRQLLHEPLHFLRLFGGLDAGFLMLRNSIGCEGPAADVAGRHLHPDRRALHVHRGARVRLDRPFVLEIRGRPLIPRGRFRRASVRLLSPAFEFVVSGGLASMRVSVTVGMSVPVAVSLIFLETIGVHLGLRRRAFGPSLASPRVVPFSHSKTVFTLDC